MSFQQDDFLEKSKKLVQEQRSKEVTHATFIEGFYVYGKKVAVAHLEVGSSR